jgi:hypothetical protein
MYFLGVRARGGKALWWKNGQGLYLDTILWRYSSSVKVIMNVFTSFRF